MKMLLETALTLGALATGYFVYKKVKDSNYNSRDPNSYDKPTEDSSTSITKIDDMDLVRAKSLTKDWADDDFVNLYDIAKRLRMNPADLLLVLTSESGLKPYAVNRRSDGFPIAVGLNQLTTAANSSAKITETERLEIPTKPVSYQLPLIENFFSSSAWFKSGKSFDHAGAIYEANFAPARMFQRGTDLKTILYEESKDGVFYTQNKQLDTAKKGYITVGDLVDYMRRVSKDITYIAGLTRLRQATGKNSLAPQLPIV